MQRTHENVRNHDHRPRAPDTKPKRPALKEIRKRGRYPCGDLLEQRGQISGGARVRALVTAC